MDKKMDKEMDEKKIQEILKYVIATEAMDGQQLTEEDIADVRAVITGEKTIEEVEAAFPMGTPTEEDEENEFADDEG